ARLSISRVLEAPWRADQISGFSDSPVGTCAEPGRQLEGVTIMTKKILCATDGSPHSDPAIGSAADMAVKFGAKMTVIAVNTYVPEGRGASHPLWTEEQAGAILASAKSKARAQASIEVETVKASGLD